MAEAAYDMTRVAAELTRIGKYKDLVVVLRRAGSTASAHQDLQVAVECLQLLRRLTTTDDWHEPFGMDEVGLLAGSLFDNAIIMYARATETKPIGRQKWFGLEMVPMEHRSTHKSVMLIRNKELAHFGSGMPIDGTPMLEEALVLVNNEAGTSLGFRANRARNRSQFSNDFSSLAKLVTSLAKEAALSRLREAQAMMTPLVTEDRWLRQLISRYPLTTNLQRGAHETANDGEGSESHTYAETVAVIIGPKP
jgi:hypothetical protein